MLRYAIQQKILTVPKQCSNTIFVCVFLRLQISSRQVTPPYKPHLQGERDLEHFDPQFTNEPVQLTPDDP